MKCPSCEHELTSANDHCPHCGADVSFALNQRDTARRQNMVLFAVIVVCFFWLLRYVHANQVRKR
jgi:hypothetical protein